MEAVLQTLFNIAANILVIGLCIGMLYWIGFSIWFIFNPNFFDDKIRR